jgi:hypothetical protein
MIREETSLDDPEQHVQIEAATHGIQYHIP